ncbi:MAG: hypothetical protein AAEJ52_08625, partial [Myxococcota bacterium]
NIGHSGKFWARTSYALRSFASKIVGEGHSPASVAQRVVDAIRKKEFWILTHPDWVDVLRRPFEGMEDGCQLVTGFGG